MIELSWLNFKNFIDKYDTKKLNISFFETLDRFFVWVTINELCIYVKDLIIDSNDGKDFLTNYKNKCLSDFSRGKDGVLTRTAAFSDSDYHRFRGKGYSFSTSGTVGISSYFINITNNISFNGTLVILKGHSTGDSISASIVDKDNILGYGPNVLLDQFLDEWFVSGDKEAQEPIILPYKANLIAGLYYKIDYNAVTTNVVNAYVNLFRHIKENI